MNRADLFSVRFSVRNWRRAVWKNNNSVAMIEDPFEEVLDTADLRSKIAATRAPKDPLRLAVERLPPYVTRAEYLALLQVLLPLARIHEDQ